MGRLSYSPHMTHHNLNTEDAKFVTVVEVNGVYELEFLDSDMQCIALKEYPTKERADQALAYWSGPHKTLSAV